MNATIKKPRSPRVRGRLRCEALGAVWSVEMRKDVYDMATGEVKAPGGVFVRRVGSRKATAERVPWAALVAGGGHDQDVDGLRLRFRWSEAGVEVRRPGIKAWRLVKWEELERLAQRQPELFKD